MPNGQPATEPAQPAQEPMPGGEDLTPATPDASSARFAPDARSVVLGVNVPAEAKLFVNGKSTTSTGADRLFISRGLEPGRAYAYAVKAEIVRGDEVLTETKEIRLAAGRRTTVSFGFNSDQVARRPVDGGTKTTLILNVPEDAKVYLAGKETTSTGPVRQFSTSKLAGDAEWAEYPVRVELTRDGEKQVEERNVTLAAGETSELTIDFDATQVARASGDVER